MKIDKPIKIHAIAWIFYFNAVSIVFVSTFQQCRNHCLKEGLLLELRSLWCKSQRTNLMLPEPPLFPCSSPESGAFSATQKLRFALPGDLPQSVTDHLLKLQSGLRLWLVTAADQHHFKRQGLRYG